MLYYRLSPFKNEGDVIFLAGETRNEIGGTHYLMIEHGLQKGLPPRLDLNQETALQEFILECARQSYLASCHDLSEGGLAIAAAECCMNACHPIGADINHLEFSFFDIPS